MLPSLNRQPLATEILLSRAAVLSREPSEEVVMVVAHGPVPNDDDRRWHGEMREFVKFMSGRSKFRRIEYLTARDYAPEPLRLRAAEEPRVIARRTPDERNKVLTVMLLLSFGEIEEGIKKRLEGLTYPMSNQALLPDERLSRWVLKSVEEIDKTPAQSTRAVNKRF